MKLVFAGEAMRILGIDDRRTLKRYVEVGEITPIDSPNGVMVFNREDVEQFAKKRKRDKESKKNKAA